MVLATFLGEPPFSAQGFVPSIWSNGDWLWQLCLLVVITAVIAFALPRLAGFLGERLGIWSTFMGITAILVAAAGWVALTWWWTDQFTAILQHIPADSFRSKLGRCFLPTIAGAILLSWSQYRLVREIVGSPLDRAAIWVIGFGTVVPALSYIGVMVTGVPFLGHFTLAAVLIFAAVIAVGAMAGQRR